MGIHPGWGGTIRLPRLLGGSSSARVNFNWKNNFTYQAAKLGLIDQLVPFRQAKRAALYYVSAKIKKRIFFAINWKKLTNHHWMRNIIS